MAKRGAATAQTVSFLVLAACVLGSGIAAAEFRTTEEYSVVNRDAIRYESDDTYTGSDARAIREQADTDLSHSVDQAEAEVFVSNTEAAWRGVPPAWIRFDDQAVTWADLSVSGSGFVGPVGATAIISLQYTGRLSLSPSPARAHKLDVETAPAPRVWTITLRIPFDWAHGAIYGAGVTQPDSTEVRLQPAGGLVTVHINEPPPPSVLPLAAVTGLLLAAVVSALVVRRRRARRRAAGEPAPSQR